MIPELVERLLGATEGIAKVGEPLRQFGHGLRRASGVGQTDGEIAQWLQGIDVREIERNRIDDFDYRALSLETRRHDRSDPTAAEEVERGGSVTEGDPALRQILARQGFDGAPLLVSSEGMRRAIDAGWTEMFRGVKETRYAQEFKTGGLHPGKDETGRGNGIWAWGRAPSSSEYGSSEFQESPGELREWAEDYTTGGSTPGSVIHMAMHPDALTTDLSSLTVKQRDELSSIDAALRKEPAESARRTELEARAYVLSDVGRFAAARGYDGYWINGTPAWVILNRTALVVER
ncbi:hypothetical protein [Nocardia grenadensis]|uniref:hypothetical protein n=1 Tax=Nocardia grenadensis TaxID=931537 RepID=UPI003D8DF8C2